MGIANSPDFGLPEVSIVYLLFLYGYLCNLHIAVMSQNLKNTDLLFVWISYVFVACLKTSASFIFKMLCVYTLNTSVITSVLALILD